MRTAAAEPAPAAAFSRGFALARFAGILSPSFPVFDSMRRVDVATGTVKWFNSTKDYGFIQPDGLSEERSAGGDMLTRTGSPQIRTTLNCHHYVKASRGGNGVATGLAGRWANEFPSPQR